MAESQHDSGRQEHSGGQEPGPGAERFEFLVGEVPLTNGEPLQIRITQEVDLDLTGESLETRTSQARISLGDAVDLTPEQARELSRRILRAVEQQDTSGDPSVRQISLDDL